MEQTQAAAAELPFRCMIVKELINCLWWPNKPPSEHREQLYFCSGLITLGMHDAVRAWYTLLKVKELSENDKQKHKCIFIV